MRQRLREWCYGRKDKRGDKRVDIDVQSCFPFLMRWIIDWWQGTRMTDPKRAERLWLAVLVATLWLLSVGGEAEAMADEANASTPDIVFPDIAECLNQRTPQSVAKPRRQRKAARLRLVSIFRRGWITILVSLIRHEPLPLSRFIPEPWPMFPYERSKPLKHKHLGGAA